MAYLRVFVCLHLTSEYYDSRSQTFLELLCIWRAVNHGLLQKPRILKLKHLRNEFHFSGVHGAMNRSGSRAK